MSGFDWPGMLRAGLRDLGLRPEQFWRLTPVELAVMLGIEGAQAPFSRARLEELARAFPDGTKGEADGGCGSVERPDRSAGNIVERGAGGDGGL